MSVTDDRTVTTKIALRASGVASASKPTSRYRQLLQSDFVAKVAQTYAAQIAQIVLTVVTGVIVVRILGPEGRGLFAIAGAIGALGVQFGNFGLHTSNTYFVARDRSLLPSLLGNTLAVSFLYGGAIAILIGTTFGYLPRLVPTNGLMLFLALAWIPFGLAYLLLLNLLLGLHEVRDFNMIEVANRFIVIVLVLALIAFRWVSPTTVFASSFVALVISVVWAYARTVAHLAVRPRLSWTIFHANLHYGLKAYLGAFFCFLVLRSDLFLVERMLGVKQAGYYSLAATMADTISLLSVAVATILFPKLSAELRLDRKLSMVWKASVGTAIIMAPLLVLASLVARPVVRLLFGTAFLPSVAAFVLLMPGIFFLSIHSVLVQFLNSIGYPKIVVIIWGISAALNVAVNVWAIPHFGISGASVVSSGSYFLATALVLIVITRYKHTPVLEEAP